MMRVKVTVTGFLDIDPKDYANEVDEDEEDIDVPDDNDILAALEEEFENDLKGLDDLDDQSIAFERVK